MKLDFFIQFLWLQLSMVLGNFIEIVWRHKKSPHGWFGGTKKYIRIYWMKCVLPTVLLCAAINALWQYGGLDISVIAEKWIEETLGIHDVGAMVISLFLGIVASHFLNTHHMQTHPPGDHNREGRTS